MARETVYGHLKGQDYFSVDSGEQAVINRVRKLKEQYPDDVEIVAENKDGTICARVPADWVKIRPKKHIELTDERRQELSERIKKAQEARFAAKD